MTSISFDPLAQVYDATRGYPEEVTKRLAKAIDQAADGHAQTRFFEVGIGTGRIGIPLAECGRLYTGIDISEKMLFQLEEKLRATGWWEKPQLWGDLPDEDTRQQLTVLNFFHERKQGAIRFVRGDMTAIPFHDASFDAVVASHVFHLVPDWQKALQEVVRILRPGGVLVRSWEENWDGLWKPGSADIRQQWSTIVQQLGGSTQLPGASDNEVTAWLQAAGFTTETTEIITWQREVSPRAILKGIEQRIWTATQLVPDPLFTASLERLRQWAHEHYGVDIDTVSTQERRIVITRTRVAPSSS